MFNFIRKFLGEKSVQTGPSLRPHQKEIFDFIVSSSSRIIGVEAGTGFGKTFLTVFLARHFALQEKRVLISTFTKQLQTELLSKFKQLFPSLKVAVLKGKGNFVCLDKVNFLNIPHLEDSVPPHLKNLARVDEYCTPQHRKVCPYKDRCEYLKMLQEVTQAQVVITNHFLLPAVSENADILIIDEVHLVDQALQSPQEIQIDFLKPILKKLPKKVDEKSLRKILEKLYREFEKENDYRKLLLLSSSIRKLERLIKEILESPNAYTKDGKLVYLPKIFLPFQNPEKVIYLSATFPDQLFSIPQPEDFISIDTNSYEGITIEILPTEYRKKDYWILIKKKILELQNKHGRVMILATSKEQLKKVKALIPEVVTTLELPVRELVEKFKNGELTIIAGTDILWTGVDVPGEKGILITKIPFEPPERVLLFENAQAVMVTRAKTKLKQGMGRLKRTPSDTGTIVIADERLLDEKFSDFFQVVLEYQRKGALLKIPKGGRSDEKARNSLHSKA